MAWPEGARGSIVGYVFLKGRWASDCSSCRCGTDDGDGGMHLWIYPGNEELGDLHHTRHMTGPGSAPFRPCLHPGLATGVGKMESCMRRGGFIL